MTTTTISIDKETRDKVAMKAKTDQISVSAVVRILLSDYAEGRIKIGTMMVQANQFEEIPVDEVTQDLMDDVVTSWEKKS